MYNEKVRPSLEKPFMMILLFCSKRKEVYKINKLRSTSPHCKWKDYKFRFGKHTSLSAGTASANLVKKVTLPSGSAARAVPAGVYVCLPTLCIVFYLSEK